MDLLCCHACTKGPCISGISVLSFICMWGYHLSHSIAVTVQPLHCAGLVRKVFQFTLDIDVELYSKVLKVTCMYFWAAIFKVSFVKCQ